MDKKHCEGCDNFYVQLYTLAEPGKQFTPSCKATGNLVPITAIENCTMKQDDTKIRYSLRFNKNFGYSAKWRKGDKKIIIDTLKESCLKAMKHSLKYLSKLPDDKLLEILEVQEYEE